MAKHLWAAEAAVLLGVPTREVIRLMYEREIRYTMIDGIARIPKDAIEEYKNRENDEGQ